ncbi:MAG: hypothetical protein AB8B71_03875 [Paracoccaceae bacterium]
MGETKPHFSFWLIAVGGLVWNLMGCLNYIAQANPDTVAQMPPVYQAIIQGRPSWATAGFAIGVFGGAVGCILLLLRKRVAVPVFVLSLAGVVLTSVFTLRVVGIVPSMVLSALMAGALLWYASIIRRFGWLR